MRSEKPDILERSITYSLQIINLYRMLEKDSVGRVLGRQLLRSGTSIGANIHEAQGVRVRQISSQNCRLLTKRRVKPRTGFVLSRRRLSSLLIVSEMQ